MKKSISKNNVQKSDINSVVFTGNNYKTKESITQSTAVPSLHHGSEYDSNSVSSANTVFSFNHQDILFNLGEKAEEQNFDNTSFYASQSPKAGSFVVRGLLKYKTN